MRDGLSNIQVRRGANQTLAGTTANNSQAFDVRGFSTATFDLHTGAVTVAGTGGFTMKLQHSDTLEASDFADAPALQVIGTAPVVDSDDDDNIIAGGLGYVGAKRYVRAVLTGTTDTNAVAFIVASMGKPHRAPVDRVGAADATT